MNLSFLSHFGCIKDIMCAYTWCIVKIVKSSNTAQIITISILKEKVCMSVDDTIFSQECL